jgi:protein gp37
MAKRLKAMGVPQYRNGFEVTTHRDALEAPYRWRKPRVVFVNSMSDLFHERVPFDFVQDLFRVMADNSRHTFQVLTKRPETALAYAAELPWSDNVWLGASIENAFYVHRARTLRRIPARVRFLSVEPLLGPIPRLPLQGIHWVIVGGESGPGARPMDADWVRRIRDRCRASGVPFFFKQWGGVHKHKTGRELDGRTWDEMPSEVGGRGASDVRVAAAGK